MFVAVMGEKLLVFPNRFGRIGLNGERFVYDILCIVFLTNIRMVDKIRKIVRWALQGSITRALARDHDAAKAATDKREDISSQKIIPERSLLELTIVARQWVLEASVRKVTRKQQQVQMRRICGRKEQRLRNLLPKRIETTKIPVAGAPWRPGRVWLGEVAVNQPDQLEIR